MHVVYVCIKVSLASSHLGNTELKQRVGNATPLTALATGGPGSVRLCNAMETDLPNSPSLPPPPTASCEIADSHPNHTICHIRSCCQISLPFH